MARLSRQILFQAQATQYPHPVNRHHWIILAPLTPNFGENDCQSPPEWGVLGGQREGDEFKSDWGGCRCQTVARPKR